MKNYLIFIMIILILIYFIDISDDVFETFQNDNIDTDIKSNISLKEFNEKFNTDIIEIPLNTALIGFDLDSDKKFLNYNHGSGEYKYLTCTLKYWMEHIHTKLNKRKYYFFLCYVDGFKFDEVTVQNFIAYNINNPLPPLITFAKRWNDEKNYLLPDPFYTCKEQHTKQFKEIDAANVKWEDRLKMCIWRGTLSYGYNTNFFETDNKDNLNQRQYFAKLYKEGKYKKVNFEQEFTSITDQIKFKYILDMDGYTNTWDANVWKLYSGSVVLKVTSTWKQWYYDELKEWVHYVPVENDLSNLNEMIEWCDNNEPKCLEIIKNAKEFVVKYFDINFVNTRIIETMDKYFAITKQV